jgi:hypothetical protein
MCTWSYKFNNKFDQKKNMQKNNYEKYIIVQIEPNFKKGKTPMAKSSKNGLKRSWLLECLSRATSF